MTMRLFTGIDLPDSIQERIDLLIVRLRCHAHVKWTAGYNLHITTRFIGDWPDSRLLELSASLKKISMPQAIDIQIRGVGWFPDAKHPKIFWAGVEATPQLAELARLTDQTLAPLGLNIDKHPYTPHLTLARIKDPVPLDPLRHAIAGMESAYFGHFIARSFFLYRSDRGPSGTIYSKLEEYSLPSA